MAQVKITGVVINSDIQRPVSGAVISLKNTSIQTISDKNGNFKIESPLPVDSLMVKMGDIPLRTIAITKTEYNGLIIGLSSDELKNILTAPQITAPAKNSDTTTANTQTEIKSISPILADSLQSRNETNPFLKDSDSIKMKISGRLINADTQQPIPDAEIILGNTQNFASSDKEGYFYVESDEWVNSLGITTSDFPLKYVALEKGDNLNMEIKFSVNDNNETPNNTSGNQSSEQTLGVIEVVAFPKKRVPKKENPAYRILNELWKRRRTNGLTNFKNYQYKEYEKIEFDLNNVDSTFMSKKIFKKLNITSSDIDTLDVINGKTYLPVFINESITDIVGQNVPSKKEKEFLLGNKASGIPNNDIIANTVKNLYKDINIYDNTLNFFNKGFTSPVATIGFSVYDYLLVGVKDVEGVSCYHIKYRPRRDNELTFKGDLYITENTYAVREVTMQSTSGINVNFVKDIYMELSYDNVNDSIFIPLRNYTVLDMSLLSKKEGTKGMFAKRTISYENYKFDQPETEVESLINRQWDPISQGAYNKKDDFWADNRPERLGEDEIKAYELVDKVSKTKFFRNIVDGVQVISSGYINIGKAVDIGNLYQSFGFNTVEGLRLRAGARTYFTPNDMWRVEGYTAYGFKDQQFKYGAEARYMFNKFNRFTVGLGTKRDITQLGVSLTEDEGVMTRSFASSSIISRGDNDFLSSVNRTNAFLSIEPWKNFQIRLDGSYQYIKSANPEKFDIGYYNKNGNKKNELYDTHLTLSIMARPGAKYSRNGLDRYEHTSLAPTIILKYVKGFNGVLDSDFNYDKLQLLYSQPILWGPIGKTNVTFEFGKIFNKLPVSLLGVLPGNQSYGIIPNTFSQLDYYDFVTDIYSALHVEHHFNGRFFSYIPLLKKLQLREVVFFRGAWGDISDGAKSLNASSIAYRAPSKDIYYEYGFGVENIGFGNLRIFRVDFNWRGNYLDMPEVSKFGVKVGMQFTF